MIHRRGTRRNGAAVEFATLGWLDWFNHQRPFEPIGNIPSVEAEARDYEQATALAMVA